MFLLQESTTSTEILAQNDTIDREEKQKSGGISFKSYKMIFSAVDSAIFVVVVMVTFVAAQIAVSSTDYFVSRWYDFLTNKNYIRLEN